MPSPAPKPRGGRRPGAGAPKGNTNAVKPCPERSRRNGLFSRRLHLVVQSLQSSPDFHVLERALIVRTRDRARARTLALLTVILLIHRLQPRMLGGPALPALTHDQLAALGIRVAQETINPQAPFPDSPPPANRAHRRKQSDNQNVAPSPVHGE